MAVTLEDRTTALERAQGETGETLRWVVAKLGRMAAVQDEHTLRLDRLETKVDRLEVKVDGLESRLGNVESRLESVELRLGSVESRLGNVEGNLDALPRAIAEMIDASEKRIMAAIAGR
jgi:chromosome segregation ATPase